MNTINISPNINQISNAINTIANTPDTVNDNFLIVRSLKNKEGL